MRRPNAATLSTSRFEYEMRMIPPVLTVMHSPGIALSSRTRTRTPRRARKKATGRPSIPAPTTMTSHGPDGTSAWGPWTTCPSVIAPARPSRATRRRRHCLAGQDAGAPLVVDGHRAVDHHERDPGGELSRVVVGRIVHDPLGIE